MVSVPPPPGEREQFHIGLVGEVSAFRGSISAKIPELASQSPIIF